MLVALVAALPGRGEAADCVCFRSLKDRALLQGCQEPFKGPNDFYARAFCRDPRTGELRTQTLFEEWVRLPDAECDCGPQPGLSRRPRGDEGDAPPAAGGEAKP